MKHVNGVYTQEVNRLYGWDGPIFPGRFKSQLIEDVGYLRTVVAYIHLNPVRAGFVRHPTAICWTSHRAYLGIDAAPPWLSCKRILRLAGGRDGIEKRVLNLHRMTLVTPSLT